MIVYERATGKAQEGEAPPGTVGQISMQRLCTLLEDTQCRPDEKLTHLEIAGNVVRFRTERKPKEMPGGS